MGVREYDCPSCGASVQFKKRQKTLTCPYCDNTIIAPESFPTDEPSEY